ncbi:hypothetical protein P22_2466 [Propionispora sp. 2/2-37]|uniref:hypothetical protein n=1 Tax=Propionispora sp. 2/2-37 TaxID=1677858 RepID=UPI0006BB8AAD|nr:hypothetical protein [Propionispora sp. 2/2-37]CUH96376.1 hypothetical protein P22_2466 [Propionispora sp. 2/2-37]
MFYIKTQINDAVDLTAEIHDDNVFTRCPECGRELAIDLVELLQGGESDLYGTAVYCAECSRKRCEGVG